MLERYCTKIDHAIEKTIDKTVPAFMIAIAGYLASLYYVENPGSMLQKGAWKALHALSELLGVMQIQNAFHYLRDLFFATILAFSLFMLLANLWETRKKITANAIALIIGAVFLIETRRSEEYALYLIAYLCILAATRIKQGAELPAISAQPFKKGYILLLLLGMIPLAAAPYAVDIRLGSAIWTHYKNIDAIEKTGLPALGEGFFDKRFALYPPLSHYATAMMQKITGMSIMENIRIGFSIFGIASIMSVFFLGRLIGGNWIGAAAAMYAGAIPELAGAAFYGSYAQLASNPLALFSVYAATKYEQGHEEKWLLASASLFGLTAATHWLLAMILGGFYLAYMALNRIGIEKALKFTGIALIFASPLVISVLLKMDLAGQTGWIGQNYPTNQHFNPATTLYAGKGLAGSAILMIGGIGALAGAGNRKMRNIYILFAVSLAMFLALQSTLTFFYTNRLILYTRLFFAFFIAYGLGKILNELVKKPIRPWAIIVASGILLIASTGLLGGYQRLYELKETPQPLGGSDWAAIYWLKENLKEGDIVATDALRAEMIYGFTAVKAIGPRESVGYFLGDKKLGETEYAYISTGGNCGFPCYDAIELDKDAEAVKQWDRIGFDETKMELESRYLRVFSNEEAYIYRGKK